MEELVAKWSPEFNSKVPPTMDEIGCFDKLNDVQMWRHTKKRKCYDTFILSYIKVSAFVGNKILKEC